MHLLLWQLPRLLLLLLLLLVFPERASPGTGQP
jgi:hypothetical protein